MAKQIKLSDAYTIATEPIASIDLMERASKAFVKAMKDNLYKSDKIIIFCGCGNNGGDGFAIARILLAKNYNVEVALVQTSLTLSSDCQINFDKLTTPINIIKNIDNLPDLANFDCIIDAIFGIGLSRSVEGIAQQVIDKINGANKMIYAVDIPSGLLADKLLDNTSIVQAGLTLSFQRPKLSFLLPESGQYVQQFKILDIGLNEEFIQQQDSNYFILDEQITNIIKLRKKYSHKGTYGHCLIIAGSYGKIGAAVLASKACLRSGSGLVTSYIPKCGYNIMQSTFPEAMCITDDNDKIISKLPNLSPYSTVAVGCGIGTEEITQEVIKKLLQTVKVPLVLDADALNILANNKWLEFLPPNCILTPHLKEFYRLVGHCNDSQDCLRKQQQLSQKYNCIIVLKGAHTSVTSSRQTFFNTSGNAGMATGGSGDILTGIIAGLLAQQYTPLEATLIAVYFHGKAGNDASIKRCQNALIASDIIDYLNIKK